MTYRLFYYPGNASLAPHILLEEARADYELVLVDRRTSAQKNPEYLKLNPNGRIPTLAHNDLVIFEAAAICLHIADHHPASELVPPLRSDERAHFYKWLMFLTNTVQAELMTYYYPENHTHDASHREELKRVAAERTMGAFDVLEQNLGPGPFVLGSRFSACDAYLFMLADWSLELPTPPTSLPRLRECLDAISARPAVRRVLETEARARATAG